MIRLSQAIILTLGLYMPQLALSQTPADLAALSLKELMGLDIDEDSAITEKKDKNRWAIGYGYQRLEFEGYRTGTNNLSDETVIFRPPEARTSKNYPVLPTVITQEVHTVNFSYKWDDNLQFGITAPYIFQSTDHKSSVPEFDAFTLKSDGFGDVSVNLAYTLPIEMSGNWKVLAGLSLPTGSIDERADTPRNGSGTNEQLPYTMQLGSGTYDFPLSIQYSNSYHRFRYGGQVNARIRTGKNSRGYRLGNTYGVNSWARWMTDFWIHPGISVAYRHTEKIHGMDDDLTIPGPFPFPANITDPDNFGSDKIDLGFSVRMCSLANNCNYYVDLNISQAVYQHLNGIQIKEGIVLGVSTGMSF